MTVLKRYRLFLILALSMGLSGCSSTGTEEPPTENTTTENNITESSSAEVISTEATEESDDVESFFTDAKECVLTEDDYTFEYNGNTFDIYSNWSDYVDKLGYPEHYEENNYGYIDTEDDGYWWNMTYPDQSEYDNDFRVVFVSPSLTKEGEDTQLNNIALTNTPTARGIKIGDSLTDLASVYGKPSSIEYFGNDADWVNIIYENDLGQITFVTDDNTVLFTLLESKAPESDESSSDEEFFKLVSYLLYLEDYDGLPEDTIYYEIINSLSEDQRMLTSDLNSFLNDVLKTDKSFEAGYESSSSEVGIRCKDDGYTYAYNGIGWDDYTVVRNVSRTSDTVDIEADIMNGIDESRLCTIKFSLYTSDNTFGYTLNRDSISKE